MIEPENAVLAHDFSATDAEGGIQRLSDYRGKKNDFLVFNRGFT